MVLYYCRMLHFAWYVPGIGAPYYCTCINSIYTVCDSTTCYHKNIHTVIYIYYHTLYLQYSSFKDNTFKWTNCDKKNIMSPPPPPEACYFIFQQINWVINRRGKKVRVSSCISNHLTSYQVTTTDQKSAGLCGKLSPLSHKKQKSSPSFSFPPLISRKTGVNKLCMCV